MSVPVGVDLGTTWDARALVFPGAVNRGLVRPLLRQIDLVAPRVGGPQERGAPVHPP